MSTYDTEQLKRLEPSYLANYGLTQAPFSNQHDDRFLYLDAERAQRLNLLQHMTQYSNLLLIVQGPPGVGKTSLLTRFIKNKADNWQICHIKAHPLMDAEQLLFQAAQGFGVQQLPQNSGEMQELLYSSVATYHHNDQIPLLVIDDADELPKDALLAIFHLADARVDDANLLRIILFASPEIEKTLNAKDVRPLRERITHTMEIPPLDEDITAEYLKHRLAVAGFNGGSPFTPKMVKRIYKASGGIPAQINQFAHEMLSKGEIGREEMEDIVVPVKPKHQYRNGVLIAVVVIVIGAVLIFQNQINRLFGAKPGPTKTMAIPLAGKSADVHLAEQKPAPARPVPSMIPTPLATQPTPATTPATVTSQLPLSLPTPVATIPPSQQPRPAIAALPPPPKVHLFNLTPDPVPASNKPQTITVNGKGFTRDSLVYVSWADRDVQIPSSKVKLVNSKQLQVTLTVGKGHSHWQLRVDDAINGNSNVIDFHVATPAFMQKQLRSWVMSQKPNTYTLQLFGSHKLANAKEFIRQHHLDGRANYFAVSYKGTLWYSVVYGAYADEIAAKAAIKTLPTSLRRVRPWVRRFADIQKTVIKQKYATAKPTVVENKKTLPDIKLPKERLFTTSLPKQGNAKQYSSWIWSQDPSYFSLQLMGVRDLDSVKRFLRRYASLDKHAIYFKSRRAGHDWYAVLYGIYPDRQRAEAAIRQLPAAIKKARPWIRSFASIQAELARAR